MLSESQSKLFLMFAIGKQMQEGNQERIECLKEMMRLMTREKDEPLPEPDTLDRLPVSRLN
jgi:hypothetical protein